MSSHLDYEINKELGECYLFMGELDKAEDYYTKAAANSEEQADPYMGLATIAMQRGDMAGALTHYSKAATIQESDKALAGLGLVHMNQGEHARAFDLFGRALTLNPANAVALLHRARRLRTTAGGGCHSLPARQPGGHSGRKHPNHPGGVPALSGR